MRRKQANAAAVKVEFAIAAFEEELNLTFMQTKLRNYGGAMEALDRAGSWLKKANAWMQDENYHPKLTGQERRNTVSKL